MEMKVSLGRAQASSYDPCYDPTLPHRVMSPLIRTRTRVWKSRPEDPRIQLKPKKNKNVSKETAKECSRSPSIHNLIIKCWPRIKASVGPFLVIWHDHDRSCPF
ncbi:hypothetical protein BDQ94DRAFT_146483 [Aspergillus welwitschiae]|uniref:Uncharacterized protein n=1 Tax=Aspergillus welwitschiae TaxID=1341132 RepID=A0A3F3PXK7_9EURO|nr:hypothetical protein BDQ94DRAFT_146483 [Aspergillus welwitschiae]RDH31700.1 hypothetical protein BDQ94DRAFT_146483 [Aspergillus welwitschiae]